MVHYFVGNYNEVGGNYYVVNKFITPFKFVAQRNSSSLLFTRMFHVYFTIREHRFHSQERSRERERERELGRGGVNFVPGKADIINLSCQQRCHARNYTIYMFILAN
jgi:hypothetical protein